ncbi:MAG: hypothetical protein DRP84_08265 [Spirochaetes bacterium]|nr:MAG: hypothetical protein DRP84_08265 [Spirochaetota bacterium]
MSIARKAIRGTFWFSGVSYITFAISLVGNMILARLLMPEDFGIFALALALNELVYILASFSFSQGVVQIQDEENVTDVAFVLSLALGVLLIILALVLSPIIAHFCSRKVAILFLILCGAGLINLLAGVYGAQLQKEFEFKSLSLVRFGASPLSMIIAVGMAFFGLGVWSLLVRSVLLSVFSFFGYRWLSSWKFKWHIDRKVFRRLFNFGCKMFFLRSLEIAYSRLDRLIIGTLSNTITLGLYHQARYLADLGNVVTAPGFFSVAFPTYAHYQNDKTRLEQSYRIVNYFLVRIMGFFLLTFALFPKEIIFLLYGQKWVKAAPALQIFCIYAFFVPIFENMKAFLMGKGQVSKAAKARLLQVASLIPLLIFGVLWKGLQGAAAATSIAMIIGILGGFYYINKSHPISFKEIHLRPLMAVALTILIYEFIKPVLNVQIKGLTSIAHIAGLNVIYALLLLIIENSALVTNIRFILSKIREKETFQLN